MATVTISGAIPEIAGGASLWPWRIAKDGQAPREVYPNAGVLSFTATVGDVMVIRNPADTVRYRVVIPAVNTDLFVLLASGGPITSGGTGPSTAPVVTTAGVTTLASDSAQLQLFLGPTTHTVNLPSAGVLAGASWIIDNQSSGAITVNSSGLNLVQSVAAGVVVTFMAKVATPTTAAHWAKQVWS